jgi:uncharacterized protein YlxW (UPF0749 family)
MMRFVMGGTIAYLGTGLLQGAILPDSLLRIFEDFPLLAIFLYSLYYLLKWMERMLEIQRSTIKEIYDEQQVFLTTLLSQIEQKQNKMADRVELLTQQVAMFGATLSEVTKVDDVIERLLERIDKA